MPYFPDGAAGNEIHYRLHLRALGEASLSEDGVQSTLVIRFTWLRTFDRPVVLRVDSAGYNLWQLHTKAGSGLGGYEPGPLTHHATRPLTNAQMDTLRTRLAAGEFWTLPSHAGALGMDGEQWILEVREGARYHYIDRWCPRDGLAYDVGRELMILSEYDFGPID
jgi:hypothetical protein